MTQSRTAPRASVARLIANGATGVAAYVIYLPIGLLLSRFMVHHIGVSAFGIWAALLGITSLSSLLDLGVTVPVVKYTAEYMVLDRRREIKELLSTAAVLYFVLAGIFGLGLAAASGWVLPHIFHVPAGDVAIRELYLAVIAGFVTLLTFSVFESLIAGMQRSDLLSRITLGSNLVNAAGVVLVLLIGWGVQGLVVNWLVVNAASIVTTLLVARRLFPELALNPFLFRRSQLRAITHFSVKVQVTNVMLFFNDQVDGALIVYALGTAMLGFYSLAARIVLGLRGVADVLTASLLPAASDLDAAGRRDRLRDLYLRASRYVAFVLLPVYAGGMSLARPFVAVWLGPHYDHYSRVALTIVIILSGYLVRLCSQVPSALLNGIGRPEIRMRADLVFLLMHIPLSAFLIWRFGYYGTLAGTAFTLASTRLYVYWAGGRALGVDIVAFLSQSLLQPALCTAAATAAAVAIQVVLPELSIPLLLLDSALFAGVYVGCVLLFGLDSQDREALDAYVWPSARRLAAGLRLAR